MPDTSSFLPPASDMKSFCQSIVLVLLLALNVSAHGGGSSDGTGGGMMGALHFTPLADSIWFASWTPRTAGTVAGASIGLFFLAVFERWVASRRTVLQAQWAHHVRAASPKTRLHAPPFNAVHDIPRGALYALQSFLGFAIMLVVMMFQVAYIISIVAGLGVGEMLFGRYAGAAVSRVD